MLGKGSIVLPGMWLPVLAACRGARSTSPATARLSPPSVAAPTSVAAPSQAPSAGVDLQAQAQTILGWMP